METTRTGGCINETCPRNGDSGYQGRGTAIFLVSALLRTFAPYTATTGPKQTSDAARRGAAVPPNCVPCSHNWPRSVAGPDRGPPGAVWGRFWPVLPRFLGGYLPQLRRRAAECVGGDQSRAETPGLGRALLGKANPQFSGRGQRPSRRREKFASVTCLLLVVVVACSYYGQRGVEILGAGAGGAWRQEGPTVIPGATHPPALSPPPKALGPAHTR